MTPTPTHFVRFARLMLIVLFLGFVAPGCRCRDQGPPTEWFVVATEGLSIREKPGEQGRLLGTAPFGASVRFLSQTEERDANGVRWLEVQHGQTRGWASGDHLNTQRLDLDRIKRRDFKGLVLFNAPTSLESQGGQMVGNAGGKEYGLSHYRHAGAEVVFLERKLRYIGDRVEWLVADVLVLDPAPHAVILEAGGNCTDSSGAVSLVGVPLRSGKREGTAMVHALERAWRIDLAGERLTPISVAGISCRSPAGD